MDKGRPMEGVANDRENYKAYVSDRVRFGGWSEVDVAEYRTEVERIMKSGTDEEKQVARDFWRIKAAPGPEAGINARIRAALAPDSLRRVA